jgi:asparagine synthase (glutamine-hydrolysing)
MCGVNAITGLNENESRAIVHGMNDTLAHRGPDHEGIFSDDFIALGHRRLSIIDLSECGNQPLRNAEGNVLLIFNGELYNYRELKNELTDYEYRSATDSEVVLAAYERWSFNCLEHLDGMFAFLIYDARSKKVFGARDRFGVKPLYWAQHKTGYIFSSEIRSILSTGLVNAEISRNAVGNFLKYQSVFPPDTMIDGIHKLGPGKYFIYTQNDFTIKEYWKIENYRLELKPDTYPEAVKKTRDLFFSAVEKRLVSDVPFGAFLSGGIDSAAVVAAMSSTLNEIQTFNITFTETGFGEAEYARLVAKKFRTRHHEILLKPAEFLQLIPSALDAMDHPTADGINTYIISQTTRKAGIKMALSGIGGDEWLGGYPIFRRLEQANNYHYLLNTPLPLRKLVAAILDIQQTRASKKMAQVLRSPKLSLSDIFHGSIELFLDKEINALLGAAPPDHDTLIMRKAIFSSISIAEWRTYLEPVLLADTDQMSMATGLEVRDPFLDHNLVKYVLGLPDHYKNKRPKQLLTDAMEGLIPAEIVHRKKMGFVLPWKIWIHHELKDIVMQEKNHLLDAGLLHPDALRSLYSKFERKDASVTWLMIWSLTSLSHWMRKNNVRVKEKLIA